MRFTTFVETYLLKQPAHSGSVRTVMAGSLYWHRLQRLGLIGVIGARLPGMSNAMRVFLGVCA